MFKNKTIQMKLVEEPKTTESTLPPRPAITTDEIVNHAMALGCLAVFGTVASAGAIIGFDTLRQVIVHTAKTKIK